MGASFFKDKNILLISPEDWNHLFVSKHHYAIELSKRNKVFFLNPPGKEFSSIKSTYNNLWVVNYTPFIKGLRFLPRFLQVYFMRRKFKQIQKLTSTRFDCVWSFDNSVFFDFSFLPKGTLKISHIVDYSQNFQFSRAASTADICFGVSQNIVDRLLTSNKNSFRVPHGVSIEKSELTELQLPGTNSIKAMYAGNLDSKYLDRSTLFELVDSHPEVDFIFLGSGGSDWGRRKNTFFLGVINYEYLGSYLAKADVLLLIYDTGKYPDQLTNSHKILEYLASGKVILSTFISDYASIPFLMEMVKDKGELPSLFNKIISGLAFYNGLEKRNARIKYAEGNSYSDRLLVIEQLVGRVCSSSNSLVKVY